MPHQSLSGKGALDKEIKPELIESKDVVSVPYNPVKWLFSMFSPHMVQVQTYQPATSWFCDKVYAGTSIFDRNMKVGSGQDDVQTDLGQRALLLVRGEDKTGKMILQLAMMV